MNHILITDSFGGKTCQVPDLGTRYPTSYCQAHGHFLIVLLLSRGIFDLDYAEEPTGEDIPQDVRISRTITQETRTGDIITLKEKLCSLHCGRKKNPHNDPQCKCG